MSKYEYAPLDSAGSQFRLLRLPLEPKQFLGERHNEPLTGSLKHYHLPSPNLPRGERIKRSLRMPIFDALSYVWGDDKLSHEILIDGRPLPITTNLYAALRNVQVDSTLPECMVWADAICINQEDFAERSAQIRLMRDIYHLASSVKVWLGPITDETIRCARFIAHLAGDVFIEPPVSEDLPAIEEDAATAVFIPSGRTRATIALGKTMVSIGQTMVNIADIIDPSYRDGKAKMILSPDNDFSLHQQTIEELASWRPAARNLRQAQNEEDFTEMAHLIDRVLLQKSDWFERMWVVQEIGAAEDVDLQIGQCSLYWRSFLRVVHYLYYTCQVRMENISKVTGIEKIRLGWNDGRRQPLRDLLWDTRYRRATDPRDKIYSLLGLMGDPMSKLLLPDYTRSVNEVYSNAAHHLVSQNSSLDPICGQQAQGRREGLPSWVPDYNLNQDLAASPLVRIDGRESIYAATGYDYQSRFLVPDISALPDSWDTLHTSGVYIDGIMQISSFVSDDETFGTIHDQWYSTLLSAGGSLQGLTDDVRRCLADISWIVRQYSKYFSSNDSNSNLPIGTKSGAVVTEAPILDAYIQTLLCGRISPNKRITREDIIALLSFQLPDKYSTSKHQKFYNRICKAFEAGMRRRKLAITKEGYIGAVPQETQPEDLICVLFGCTVPVVLRRNAVAENTTDGISYKFVGEAYLHGFMDAEAIVMLVKGTRNLQEFTLK